MRQITKQAVNKFNNNKNYKKDNTRIEYQHIFSEPTTIMYLHNNIIAQKLNKEIRISNCGWFSNTTKERLNGLLDSIGFNKIYQKNFEWFLADKKWNGKPVKLIGSNNWEYI